MALEFLGTLFAADNKTGASRFVGVGHADRYNPVTAGELTSSGLTARGEFRALLRPG